jgi:hypothetical protein
MAPYERRRCRAMSAIDHPCIRSCTSSPSSSADQYSPARGAERGFRPYAYAAMTPPGRAHECSTRLIVLDPSLIASRGAYRMSRHGRHEIVYWLSGYRPETG